MELAAVEELPRIAGEILLDVVDGLVGDGERDRGRDRLTVAVACRDRHAPSIAWLVLVTVELDAEVDEVSGGRDDDLLGVGREREIADRRRGEEDVRDVALGELELDQRDVTAGRDDPMFEDLLALDREQHVRSRRFGDDHDRHSRPGLERIARDDQLDAAGAVPERTRVAIGDPDGRLGRHDVPRADRLVVADLAGPLQSVESLARSDELVRGLTIVVRRE